VLGVGLCEWGDCVSVQKCECSSGGLDIFSLVIILAIAFYANCCLYHISEWHKRDGIQRGFAVAKENGDVEWKPLGVNNAK
jgi:hypothetical protein